MSEIKDLIEKSDKSIEAATLLLREGFTEFSVGRSYYSMYYLVEALLITKDLFTKTHSGAIGLFSKEFIKTGIFSIEWSEYLAKALDARSKGDYEVGSIIDAESAKEILDKAILFNELITSYLKENNFI
jgi:uncharacterized protein (UPF0332 family)